MKKTRRKVELINVNDVSVLGQMTKEELLADSERFEPENYNPLENSDILEKETKLWKKEC